MISSSDRVLAKQSINSYGDIKVAFSAETLKHLDKLVKGAQKDIEETLGLDEEKGESE